MAKSTFDILYDKTLKIKHILRATDQRLPFVWQGLSDEDNQSGLTVTTGGTYSGEIKKSYIVQITASGVSGESKFKLSRDDGESYLGHDGNEWVAYDGSNDKFVDFDGNTINITENLNITFADAGSGELNDKYYFKGEYRYPIENLHNLYPLRKFQSDTDNQNWELIWDLGSYGYLTGDTVVATGFNVPQIKIQANDSDSWTSPSVDKTIDFVDEIGTVNEIYQTRIVFTTASWGQKTLIGKYLKMTSGTANGNVYKIIDNYSNELVFEDVGLIDAGIAVNDTFQIFSSDRYSKLNSVFRHRFLRLLIPTTQTYENYYTGNSIGIGKSLSSAYDYQQNGVTQNRNANVTVSESIGGSEQINWRGNPEKTFTFNFDLLDEDTKKLYDAMRDYLQDAKEPFYFLPDSGKSGEIYPCRFVQGLQTNKPVNDRYTETWSLKVLR